MPARPNTRRIARLSAAALTLALWCTPFSQAQSSTSFEIDGAVLNGGGRPEQGTTAQSTSYSVRTDAIGEAFSAVAMSSPSFQLSSGFLPGYAPVGEVGGLVFFNKDQLAWLITPNAASYSGYRDAISTLPGNYGACAVTDLASPDWFDPTVPSAGTGLFYLVTAVNRIGEEGTKGFTSSGAVRSNVSPCP